MRDVKVVLRFVRILPVVCAVLVTRTFPLEAAEAPTVKALKQAADKAEKSAEKADESAAKAEDATKQLEKAIAEAKKYPTDLENYLGDTIVLNGSTRAVVVHPLREDEEAHRKASEAGKDAKPASEVVVSAKDDVVYIPSGTYLKGGTLVDVLNRVYAFVPACTYCEIGVNCDAGFYACAMPQDTSKGADADVVKQAKEEGVTCEASYKPRKIEKGTKLHIRLSDFNDVPPNRYGVTFGGLVVPFKFQLTGKQDFKASASAAPYMGYRLGFTGSGVELAPVVFAGIGVVSATKTKEKTSTTDGEDGTTTKTEKTTTELASFSYGFGLIGTLKRSFHFGGLIGFDHTGSGKGYKYNDKPWFAVELGASFN